VRRKPNIELSRWVRATTASVLAVALGACSLEVERDSGPEPTASVAYVEVHDVAVELAEHPVFDAISNAAYRRVDLVLETFGGLSAMQRATVKNHLTTATAAAAMRSACRTAARAASSASERNASPRATATEDRYRDTMRPPASSRSQRRDGSVALLDRADSVESRCGEVFARDHEVEGPEVAPHDLRGIVAVDL
jgi:hypothetical protein